MTLLATATYSSVKKERTKSKPRKIQTETTSEPAQDVPVDYNPVDFETMLAITSGGHKGHRRPKMLLKCRKKPESPMAYSYVPRRSSCQDTKEEHNRVRQRAQVDDVHQCGKFHDRNGEVPDIDARFARTAIAPAIVIAVEFMHGNKKHTSSVQWLFGPVYDHKTNKQVRCIVPGSDVITQHLDGEMPYIGIKSQSDFAVKNFCHLKKTHPVHLRFYFHSKEFTELKEQNSTEYKFLELMNALAHRRAKLRMSFAGYKNDSGEVQAIAKQMKDRSAMIVKGTPLEAHPPLHV
ncbi:hypothetical protein LTR27_011066 [Elasticomyces elasticus]|nr:hypothetical protein LTR27_011066 [Elasticomyces elasticus]